MKKDWDLIRNILIDIEEHGAFMFRPPNASQEDDDMAEAERIHANAWQLAENEFITLYTFRPNGWFSSLTRTGRELLNAIRDDALWARIKAGAGDPNINSIPLNAMTDIAADLIKHDIMVAATKEQVAAERTSEADGRPQQP